MNVPSHPAKLHADSKDEIALSQHSKRQAFWNTVLSREVGGLPARAPVPLGEAPIHDPRSAHPAIRRSSSSFHLAAERAAPLSKRAKPKFMRGRKPSSCPYCGQVFKRGYDLSQHVNAVHLKIKSFDCSDCKKRFAHKGTLSKHHKTVHLGLRPYSCSHCGHRFSEKGNVNKHMQRTAKCRQALEMSEKKRQEMN